MIESLTFVHMSAFCFMSKNPIEYMFRNTLWAKRGVVVKCKYCKGKAVKIAHKLISNITSPAHVKYT